MKHFAMDIDKEVMIYTYVSKSLFTRNYDPHGALQSVHRFISNLWKQAGIHYLRKRISLTRAGTGLLGLTATSATSVHLALGLRIRADILERSSVPVVAVDTSQLTTVDRGHALDVDVALTLLRALRSCKRLSRKLALMIDITYVSA